YDLGMPSRYDIAVFEKENSSLNMKRIIGLPGETVQIKDNLVYINGTPLDSDDVLGQATIAGIAEFPIELGEDEYFLLGDNRESSEDSRFSGIGTIKREQLTGKVWFKFQPIEEFGLIQ
ncbi:MAG: signal peptidase I, partial [Lachnospiraceae bacterium]|nr:signal peptidase I [Lachnospiraceae bacterium]